MVRNKAHMGPENEKQSFLFQGSRERRDLHKRKISEMRHSGLQPNFHYISYWRSLNAEYKWQEDGRRYHMRPGN